MSIKALRTALVAASLTLAASLHALPAHAGPACTDFTGGAHQYTTDTDPTSATFGDGLVKASSQFAAATCGNVDYTVHVYDASGTTQLDSLTHKGNGELFLTHRFVLDADPISPPEDICLVGESSRNGRVIDRAPDTGCLPLKLGKSPGAQNWY